MKLKDLGWRDSLATELNTLEAGLTVGRIATEHRQVYQVYTDAGELSAEVTGQFRHQAAGFLDYPAVGDWVALRLLDEATHAMIHQVLPRHSQFVRKVAGNRTEGQVIAANIDTVFLVMGLDGDFNLRRIERYLVLVWESGANPVILLNKADQCSAVAERLVAVTAVAPGVPILPISARTGAGIESLTPYLQTGQTVALVGSSGVGKSTLANHLLGQAQQATQTVRSGDQRGRHTTTARHLLRLPTGALLIDTPGMRELQLWSTAEGLEDTFADLEDLAAACRFRDCTHRQEPGCAVQGAIAAGDLAADRLHSYQKLQQEHRYLANRQDAQANHNSKRRWKAIHKAMRQHPKR